MKKRVKIMVKIAISQFSVNPLRQFVSTIFEIFELIEWIECVATRLNGWACAWHAMKLGTG